MRIVIAAIGRLKGEEQALVERYVERLNGIGRRVSVGPAVVVEIGESRAANASQRRDDEARRLMAAVPDGAAPPVVLDVLGKPQTSEAFAAHLARERDGGSGTLAFLIGGPDGHGETISSVAQLRLSLGPMTLPHGLARVVLAEQLYRAATILAGHPYHRA